MASVDLLARLLKRGLSRKDPKTDLLNVFGVLRDLEESAQFTYDRILERSDLSVKTRKIIKGIRSDEVKHVKMAEQLVRMMEDYDYGLEIVTYPVREP